MFQRSTKKTFRPGLAAAMAVCAAGLIAPNVFGDIKFTNGGGDNAWNNPANWNGGALPGTGDTASVFDNFTTNLATTQSVSEVEVGDGDQTATLNILPGADLTTSSHVIVGRSESGTEPDPASLGQIFQTGGTVNIGGKLRIGYAKNNNPGGYYKISGGTLNITEDVDMQHGTGGYYSDRTEFEVDGSAPIINVTSDFIMDHSDSPDPSVLTFDIGATGVSTINVGNALYIDPGAVLKINVTAATNVSDITLVKAGGAVGTDAADYPSGDGLFVDSAGNTINNGGDVSAIFDGNQYTWTLNYTNVTGGTNNGVYLSNLRVTPTPEPASLALLALGGLLAVRRKRRA